LGYAYDSERDSVDLDLSPYRIERREQLAHNLTPDEADVRAMLFFLGTDIPTLAHPYRIYVDHIVGNAPQYEVLQSLTLVLDLDPAADLGSSILNVDRVLHNCLEILDLYVLVLPALLDPFLEAGDEPHFVDDKSVGSQVGNLLFYVLVEPFY